ncbi:hypothetical protein SAMN05443574_13518 [Haloarcula vallismortis]|uniref:Uncharacterized protein n=2 Tax=Haloarcula vallismortis TaxID=28442 RepID=M0J5M4_HALVA|nr:hypothetical protein [Haloarcula vallismortis]EMA04271.1 hypothetical protein C437_13962 [Haloarcula vallismortis ATCC 29715]SDX35585.1 hypothetical protein SAMN05443574_13518 [Haloarcula vallismortis]
MDRRALPLTPAQLEELLEHAENPQERLPVEIIAGTGVSLQEFLHLREDWITWPNDVDALDVPLLRIPEEAPCGRTRLQPSHQTVLSPTPATPPCLDCERQPGPSKFFVDFDRRARRVPLVDEDAADALRWWFDRYDCIPFGRDLRGFRTLVERTDLENVSAQDLRWTFGRRLADMEFPREEIADVMGVNPRAVTMSRVLRASSTDYGIQTHHTVEEYLDAIGEPGDTATSAELAERLDLVRDAVTKRLRTLVDEDDRVEAVKSGHRGEGRKNVYRRLEADN